MQKQVYTTSLIYPIAAISISTIKKAKIAKNILNKKITAAAIFVAGILALTLQFL